MPPYKGAEAERREAATKHRAFLRSAQAMPMAGDVQMRDRYAIGPDAIQKKRLIVYAQWALQKRRKLPKSSARLAAIEAEVEADDEVVFYRRDGEITTVLGRMPRYKVIARYKLPAHIRNYDPFATPS